MKTTEFAWHHLIQWSSLLQAAPIGSVGAHLAAANVNLLRSSSSSQNVRTYPAQCPCNIMQHMDVYIHND
eukprot:COSAG03_NODE_2373_length_2829_cov_16.656410_4_plen_70_part_00